MCAFIFVLVEPSDNVSVPISDYITLGNNKTNLGLFLFIFVLSTVLVLASNKFNLKFVIKVIIFIIYKCESKILGFQG